MDLYDAVPLSGARLTADGYLVAEARIARTGIQDYLGAELGRPDLPRVRVLRAEDDVFSADAMASLAHRPMTDDHPPENVTAANWKRYAIGFTGAEVARDGAYIRVPLTLMDGAAVAAVQSGKRELSVGYGCTLDWTAGVTDAGEPYDARMTNIRGNHLAVVDRGRAGPACRIGDGPNPQQQGAQAMPGELTKVVVDGLSIETTPQGAEALAKVQGQLRDAQSAAQAAAGTHAATLAAKDGDIAARDAKLANLEARLTPAALDAAVASRAGLIASAKRVLGDTFDGAGKTEADIRRAVVAHRLGDKMPADADAAFVDAAFRFQDLTGDATSAPRDPVRDALANPRPVNDAGNTYEARMAARFAGKEIA